MKHTVDLKIDAASIKANADTIDHYFEKTIKQCGKVMLTYIVSDTIRQVIVAQATK